ncbi:MAG: alpha/beta fold hydrolase [Chloroflexi bacterium]|nr:MAG: alpha/beta fold hydrolase [Chloroflexota bacterium]
MPMKKFLLILLIIIVLLGGATLGISYYAANSLVHSPRATPLDQPENYGYAYENMTFSPPDDPAITLKGWFIPPKPEKNGATIIYVHGFQAERSWLLSQARFMIDEGYGALMFDLRNSGESGGTMTYFGAKEWQDVAGAVNFLRARPEVNTDKLGIMGRSMGGGVVIRAAAELQIFKFVIAQSTFTDAESLVSDVVPLSTGLPSFPFAPLIEFFAKRETGVSLSEINSVAELQKLGDTPVMIIHGTQDDWIPFKHGQKLYQAAIGPKVFYAVEGALHYPLLDHDPVGLPKALLSFVDTYLK